MGKNDNRANRTTRKAALAIVLPSMLVIALVFASFSFFSQPTIHSASVEPQKVRPGDIMLISAQVSDSPGIREVTADMTIQATSNSALRLDA